MYLHFAATLYPVGDPCRHTVIMQLAFRKPLNFFLNASWSVTSSSLGPSNQRFAIFLRSQGAKKCSF